MVSVPNLTFAGSATMVSAATVYSSSAFIGNALVDDFRVVRWTGAETTWSAGPEQVP